jgi:hypothetical protein
MANPAFSQADEAALEAQCLAALAQADRARAGATFIVRHLLASPDAILFSERIVARTGALLHDLARRLIAACDGPQGRPGKDERAAALAAALADHAPLLGHIHAIAFEAHETDRLEARLSLDPVVPPVLRERFTPGEPGLGASLLAAQTRFCEAQRRGELPFEELPGDLLRLALTTMRVCAEPERDADAALAERGILARYDERASRLNLLGQAVEELAAEAGEALDLASGGVALFLSALASGAGLDRDRAALALAESQRPYLILALTACGLERSSIEDQILLLHPEAVLPDRWANLSADRAAALLADGPGNA